jgi:hypothetical protein
MKLLIQQKELQQAKLKDNIYELFVNSTFDLAKRFTLYACGPLGKSSLDPDEQGILDTTTCCLVLWAAAKDRPGSSFQEAMIEYFDINDMSAHHTKLHRLYKQKHRALCQAQGSTYIPTREIDAPHKKAVRQYGDDLREYILKYTIQYNSQVRGAKNYQLQLKQINTHEQVNNDYSATARTNDMIQTREPSLSNSTLSAVIDTKMDARFANLQSQMHHTKTKLQNARLRYNQTANPQTYPKAQGGSRPRSNPNNQQGRVSSNGNLVWNRKHQALKQAPAHSRAQAPAQAPAPTPHRVRSQAPARKKPKAKKQATAQITPQVLQEALTNAIAQVPALAQTLTTEPPTHHPPRQNNRARRRPNPNQTGDQDEQDSATNERQNVNYRRSQHKRRRH